MFRVDSYNRTYDQPNPDIFPRVAPVQSGSSDVPTTDTVSGFQYELSIGGVPGYNLDVGCKRRICCDDHVSSNPPPLSKPKNDFQFTAEVNGQ